MAYGNAGKSDDGSGPVTNRSDAAAIIAALKDAGDVKTIEIGTGGVLAAVPKGVELKDLTDQVDKLASQPVRRSGTETVHDLEAFTGQINRYKGPHTQVWGTLVINADGDVKTMSLTSIVDAPEGGQEASISLAHWGRHRVQYDFPLSREWQAWAAIDGKAMNQGQLAAFLERRLSDMVPEPTSLFTDPITNQQRSTTAVTDPAILKLLGELEKRVASPNELVKIARSFTINRTKQAAVSTSTPATTGWPTKRPVPRGPRWSRCPT